VFGVIIFFHELGHFIVAKMNHITVKEFSMGLGPKLFGFKKKETQYSLRLIPLGGYCMMLSEDEEENENDENSFDKKSIWARMAVVLAGPFMNIVIAFVFSMVIIHFCGSDPAIIDQVYDAEMAADENYADALSEFNGVYPAQEAGIEDGDRVLKISGKTIKNFRELQIYLQIYGDGSPIDMELERENGEVYDTTVYPVETSDGYKVGIISSGYVLPENAGELIKYSCYEVRYWVKATFLSLKLIVTRQVSSDEVSGPVGVAKSMNDTFSEAAKVDVLTVLLNWMNYIVLLSANLGIMNMLPIPGLDGGRFLFLLIELITRRKVPKDKENIVTVIGFVIVMILMVVILSNDIKNVFFS
jgi:regulator of sigma E protease